MDWSEQEWIPYGESVVGRFAPRPYQMPDAVNPIAQAPVNSIKNGEGNMNQATTAAAAESPPLT